MKRIIALAAAFVLTLAGASTVSAGVFDDYYDYENEDGTYTYYFMQGLKVTVDEDFYQKTIVRAGDGGATFYHKASYEAYLKEGFDGGRLFTLGASVNRSFEKLPHFKYIGFDEEEAMNYFADLPSDLQAYMGDKQTANEYVELYQKVEDVIDGIEIVGQLPGETSGDSSAAAAGGNETSGSGSAAAGGNETSQTNCNCDCACCKK